MIERIRKILVTTDGSTGSEAVFPAVMPLVRAFDPEVVILYVFEDPEAEYLAPSQVQTACAALRTAGVNAYLEVKEGEPAEEILRVARDKKVDLIAMSTQGRTGVVRLIAGSVAEEVLRQSEIPLLITRPPVVVREWKSIAVALDGSPRAEEILADAARLARALGATIDVIQASAPVVAGGMGEVAMVFQPEDPMPYLKGVVTRLQAQGLTAAATALEGRAAGEILRHLQATGASLLCMTTHGRSGFSRLLLGSVAEEVIRNSPCPVLLRRTASSAQGVGELAVSAIQVL